jgi:tRNA nucleotidyltransferase (CCA-adding enzyme)
LAALSRETFEDFQKKCLSFLKNPTLEAFEVEEMDLDKMKEYADKNKYEFAGLEFTTNKQKGDIAGSKLLKFYKHLKDEMSRYFDVKKSGFEYEDSDKSKCFYVVESKKIVLVEGPFVKDIKSIEMFKKRHSKFITKKGRVYAEDKVDFSIQEFVSKWKVKNEKRMNEMGIISIIDIQ